MRGGAVAGPVALGLGRRRQERLRLGRQLRDLHGGDLETGGGQRLAPRDEPGQVVRDARDLGLELLLDRLPRRRPERLGQDLLDLHLPRGLGHLGGDEGDEAIGVLARAAAQEAEEALQAAQRDLAVGHLELPVAAVEGDRQRLQRERVRDEEVDDLLAAADLLSQEDELLDAGLDVLAVLELLGHDLAEPSLVAAADVDVGREADAHPTALVHLTAHDVDLVTDDLGADVGAREDAHPLDAVLDHRHARLRDHPHVRLALGRVLREDDLELARVDVVDAGAAGPLRLVGHGC